MLERARSAARIGLLFTAKCLAWIGAESIGVVSNKCDTRYISKQKECTEPVYFKVSPFSVSC